LNSADNQTFLQSDVTTGLEIVAENALRKWNEIIGPDNSNVAKS
jgi:hypothetical protein